MGVAVGEGAVGAGVRRRRAPLGVKRHRRRLGRSGTRRMRRGRRRGGRGRSGGWRRRWGVHGIGAGAMNPSRHRGFAATTRSRFLGLSIDECSADTRYLTTHILQSFTVYVACPTASTTRLPGFPLQYYSPANPSVSYLQSLMLFRVAYHTYCRSLSLLACD